MQEKPAPVIGHPSGSAGYLNGRSDEGKAVFIQDDARKTTGLSRQGDRGHQETRRNKEEE